jgi:O-antigen/teichoic acid export membrane protein
MVFDLAMRAYDKIDLLLVARLTGSTEETAAYAAAQQLSLPAGLFAMAFSPVLMSTVARHVREGRRDAAQGIVHSTLVIVVVAVPSAGVVSIFAPEIVSVVFGRPWDLAAAALRWLAFDAVALLCLSMCAAILTVDDPWILPRLALPMLAIVVTADCIVIPYFGSDGAAATAACVASGMLVCAMMIVVRRWGVPSRASRSGPSRRSS